MQLAEQDREKEDISVARDDFEARELFFFFCFDDCHTRAMFGPSHRERETLRRVSHWSLCSHSLSPGAELRAQAGEPPAEGRGRAGA